MKKHTIQLWLISVAALVVTGGLAACNTTDTDSSRGFSSDSISSSSETVEITLDGFENTEDSVLLGEKYTLPTENAKDTSGKEYAVTYQVQTSTGEKIAPVENAFYAYHLGEYIITCYAKVGIGDVRTRTITVKVKDELAPEITFTDVKTGMVGKRYVLPKISVIDDSGENIKPTAKLYECSGDTKGDEVQFSGGVFIPSKAGEYLFEVTAKDSSENSVTKTVKMYIREKVKEYEVLPFNHETDIEKVGLLGADVCYLDEYEGDEGVVKFSYTGGYWANRFTFLPLCDLSDDTGIYEKYDSFILRMYIVKTNDVQNYFTNIAIKDYKTNENYYSPTEVVYNEWVDYQFPVAYLKLFQADALDVTLGTKIFGYGNEELKGNEDVAKGEFYLSDIYLSKDLTIDVAGDALVGATVDISMQETEEKTVTTVKSPSGIVTTLTDGTYTIAETGVHTVYVHGEGCYGKTEFSGALAALNTPIRNVTWNGYNVTTYGSSVITKDGAVTLAAGEYSGASPRALGTANVPYIAFNGNHSLGKTVVVDFTGGNLPNIAFFADQPSENTKNFVGAKGLMFSRAVLAKDGTVFNTTYANRLNIYGPNFFTKYSDTSSKEDIYNTLFYPYGDTSYEGVQKSVFMDYAKMQSDTTTKYRLLVRFDKGTKLACSVVLMSWDTAQNSYKIVYKGERSISQTYAEHGLTDGSVIIYGRPYVETKIDKLHVIYESANDGELVYNWTGKALWGYTPPSATTKSAELENDNGATGTLPCDVANPKKREEY